MEPESSTGPKKSRFNSDEPPLAEQQGRPGLRSREGADTCSSEKEVVLHEEASRKNPWTPSSTDPLSDMSV